MTLIIIQITRHTYKLQITRLHLQQFIWETESKNL